MRKILIFRRIVSLGGPNGSQPVYKVTTISTELLYFESEQKTWICLLTSIEKINKTVLDSYDPT